MNDSDFGRSWFIPWHERSPIPLSVKKNEILQANFTESDWFSLRDQDDRARIRRPFSESKGKVLLPAKAPEWAHCVIRTNRNRNKDRTTFLGEQQPGAATSWCFVITVMLPGNQQRFWEFSGNIRINICYNIYIYIWAQPVMSASIKDKKVRRCITSSSILTLVVLHNERWMALYEFCYWWGSVSYLARWTRNGCHISKNVLRLSIMPYQPFSICNIPVNSLNQVLNWGTASFICESLFLNYHPLHNCVLHDETLCFSRDGEIPNNAYQAHSCTCQRTT